MISYGCHKLTSRCHLQDILRHSDSLRHSDHIKISNLFFVVQIDKILNRIRYFLWTIMVLLKFELDEISFSFRLFGPESIVKSFVSSLLGNASAFEFNKSKLFRMNLTWSTLTFIFLEKKNSSSLILPLLSQIQPVFKM